MPNFTLPGSPWRRCCAPEPPHSVHPRRLTPAQSSGVIRRARSTTQPSATTRPGRTAVMPASRSGPPMIPTIARPKGDEPIQEVSAHCVASIRTPMTNSTPSHTGAGCCAGALGNASNSNSGHTAATAAQRGEQQHAKCAEPRSPRPRLNS
jgi:hypothetical protein